MGFVSEIRLILIRFYFSNARLDILADVFKVSGCSGGCWSGPDRTSQA